MTVKRDAEFERAVRIEMLRARAAVERAEIASSATDLAQSLNPRIALGRMLPGNAQGVLSRGLSLVSRYPYVLTAVLSNRRFKAVRWVSLAALAIGAWAMLSGKSADEPDGSQDHPG